MSECCGRPASPGRGGSGLAGLDSYLPYRRCPPSTEPPTTLPSPPMTHPPLRRLTGRKGTANPLGPDHRSSGSWMYITPESMASSLSQYTGGNGASLRLCVVVEKANRNEVMSKQTKEYWERTDKKAEFVAIKGSIKLTWTIIPGIKQALHALRLAYTDVKVISAFFACTLAEGEGAPVGLFGTLRRGWASGVEGRGAHEAHGAHVPRRG